METKQRFRYMDDLRVSLGYDDIVTVEPVGLSGGLCLLWKSSYQVTVLSSNPRLIDIKVKLGSLEFFLTCVYGDPVQGNRQHVWDQLSHIGIRRNMAWSLIGDFNELLNNEEKLGGPARRDATFWGFRTMVEDCKIREIRSSGNSFSWSGWRDQIWIQCRLDRSFGNEEWFQLFPRAQLEYLAMWGSDHRPIRLSFSLENEDQSRGRFYFDKRLIAKEGFEEVVRKGWENGQRESQSLMDRIANCRREIAKWKRSSNCNSRSRIQHLQSALEREMAKIRPSRARMRELKTELAAACRDEEIFWREKSRVQWLQEGDMNTPYFFNCVKGKQMKNKVLMLLDDMGQELFSEGAKGHLAVEYFRELFMSSNPADLESLFQGFEPRVTTAMNEWLTAPVSDEEIKTAAFSVKGSSAPGEDGLTGIFYQRFWHIVGPEIIQEVKKFFQTAIIPSGWNHTHLSLIPKITNPTRLTEMRPISLCSVQYKIISRILCDRLKAFLPDIISPTQGAFVSGRLITDNILIAHEMVHGLKTSESVSKDFMAIKTDMSKAYDRVEWSFLEILLERMGFDRTWVRWTMACVNSVSYSILLNGRTHGFIRPERGIRQGDPLSPFLFILAAEALVGRLNQSEHCSKLHGIRLNASGPSVHHLLFADDSLLMCQASVAEAGEVVECLKEYGAASGQMINQAKSSIIFGSKVPQETRLEIMEVLGIHKEGGEGTYLGLPECFSGSKRQLLNFVQERLQGRVKSWSSKALSSGGKEILIKTIGLAMPIYAMTCFRLPKNLCEKLTSVLIQFWWGSKDNQKKIPWVAWKKLCKEKEKGGIGFREIEKFNQALLGKQAWRILNNPDSLLSQILKHRYFRNNSFMDSTLGARPSYAWRSILHGRSLLSQGLVQSINTGADTSVWLDKWIMDSVPRTPNYRADSTIDLTLKVSDLFHNQTRSWNVALVRSTFTVEDANLVLRTKIGRKSKDELLWGFTANIMYSSKSGYKLLETLQELQYPDNQRLAPIERELWKKLWKLQAPLKLRHFLWKVLAGALAVKERLFSRGINVDSTCSYYHLSSETICHVLFQCPRAKETWELSGYPLPSQGFSSTSVFLNLHHLIQCSLKRSIDARLWLIFPWIMWQIWKARNAFTFENTRLEPSNVLQRATEEGEIWLSLNKHLQVETNQRPLMSENQGHWQRPNVNTIKCNVGVSWSPRYRYCGVSWLTRNHDRRTLHHSRRAYSNVTSLMEAELLSMEWAVESMRNLRQNRVIFESSFASAREALLHPECFPQYTHLISSITSHLHYIPIWSLDYVGVNGNQAAMEIAVSVIRNHKTQSYVARNGPLWLSHILEADASLQHHH